MVSGEILVVLLQVFSFALFTPVSLSLRLSLYVIRLVKVVIKVFVCPISTLLLFLGESNDFLRGGPTDSLIVFISIICVLSLRFPRI